MAASPTVRETLLRAAAALEEITPSAFREAELILSHEIGTTRAGLYLAANEPIGTATAEHIQRVVEARASGEPLQYLLRGTGFFGLDIIVDKGVLVPRPETEILVDKALEVLKRFSGAPFVLDLCTGSGAIALALAANDRRVKVLGTDVSRTALEIANRNIASLELGGRVSTSQGDLFDAVPDVPGSIDLVVSNPPYIPTGDLPGLPLDVLREPGKALDGGPDGLMFYRRIAEDASDYLKKGGAVFVEVGDGQAPDVVRLFERAAFGDVEVVSDLCGVDRVVGAVFKG